MHSSKLYLLGRFCAGHPIVVLALWSAASTAVIGLAIGVGGETTDDIRVPGSESERGTGVIGDHFPGADGATAQVVFHRPGADVLAGPGTAVIRQSLAEVAALDGVSSVIDPWQFPSQVSASRQTAYATVIFDRTVGELGAEGAAEVSAAVQPARSVGVEAVVGGDLGFVTSGAQTGGAETIGIGVALVVLVLIFGSVVAAGLPLVTAACALAFTFAAVVLFATVSDVATEAPQVAAMIGLGVGIDYALILVTRHREELARGVEIRESIAVSTATAGRSILFAGGTVVIAVCALFLTGLPLVMSLGAAAALVVGVAVVAAVTLLPALMSIAGARLMPKRRNVAEPEHTWWARATIRVARRPGWWLAGAIAVLAVFAAPATTIELTMPDAGSTAQGSEVRRAYDLVAAEFGAGNSGPLFVVAEVAEGSAGEVGRRLRELVGADPGIASVTPALTSRDGGAVLVQAIPNEAPRDPATEATVERLRAEFAAFVPNAAVTGATATYVDFSEQVRGSTVVVVAVVVAFCTILLLIVFRSIAVALRAALVNILSIAAAFGVVVVVFQWGWASALFGMDEPTPIAVFVPLLMFAVVFGLSMDYEVFLIARIREETIRAGGDTTRGLIVGMTTTAKVISSAAVIMISVFTAFAFAPEPVLKLLGLGLAAAVLFDATIVRLIVLPAAIALLGNRTWELPPWLDRILPRFEAEPIHRAGHARRSTPPSAKIRS
ncbi:MMPL family transporter [Nocardia sp. CNY236]|uniref:MMPL family transporter n=1 Tax=Nocardia sp. CNY236 TaxID=1169152 RepID=UPI000417A783|nr:MMPL family transporter [Nocardia sp. CNY236]